jgi:membrane associated rhomboid family serine protease/Zn-finger nucleic acid-binding protein
MRHQRIKEQVVDICSRCAGVWFDIGELRRYLHYLLETEPIRAKTPVLFEPPDAMSGWRVNSAVDPGKLCPDCHKPLIPFNYAYDSNIFLDKCPECEGIWAEESELLAVTKHLKFHPAEKTLGLAVAEHTKYIANLEAITDALNIAIRIPFIRILLPLKDEKIVRNLSVNRRSFPWLTFSLITITSLLFLLQTFLVLDYQAFFKQYGLVPVQLAKGYWLPLFTSIFVHAGFFHLFGNLFFLWLFGDNVEERLGHFSFLLFYLVVGAVAGLIYALGNSQSSVPVVGASGAIAGVMGAYFVFFPEAEIRTLLAWRVVRIPALFYLGGWFLIQIFNTVFSSVSGVSGVAWLAHVAGFLLGAALAYGVKRYQREELLTERQKNQGIP